jgi:hypothetical protein
MVKVCYRHADSFVKIDSIEISDKGAIFIYISSEKHKYWNILEGIGNNSLTLMNDTEEDYSYIDFLFEDLDMSNAEVTVTPLRWEYEIAIIPNKLYRGGETDVEFTVCNEEKFERAMLDFVVRGRN